MAVVDPVEKAQGDDTFLLFQLRYTSKKLLMVVRYPSGAWTGREIPGPGCRPDRSRQGPSKGRGVPLRTFFSAAADLSRSRGCPAKQASTGSRREAGSPACCTCSRGHGVWEENPAAMVRRRRTMVPPQPRAWPMSWQRGAHIGPLGADHFEQVVRGGELVCNLQAWMVMGRGSRSTSWPRRASS